MLDTGFTDSGVEPPGDWWQLVACRSLKRGDDTVWGSVGGRVGFL